MNGAYVMDLGRVEYEAAWELQRSLAAAVSLGAIPDTVLFLEHPPTITLGRRTEEGEVHVPDGADVAIVETDRGGRSTYHGPGQLVCYPILDLKRHGKDVKKFCRDLEEAIVHPLAAVRSSGRRGSTDCQGVWLEGHRRASSRVIGACISRWVSTHGYALNVDLDPAPFTDWITACGLYDASFTSMAHELGRPVTVDEVRPAARAAIAEVFELEFDELPGDEPGLWPQPLHCSSPRASGVTANVCRVAQAALRVSCRRVRCRSLGLSRWALRQSM